MDHDLNLDLAISEFKASGHCPLCHGHLQVPTTEYQEDQDDPEMMPCPCCVHPDPDWCPICELPHRCQNEHCRVDLNCRSSIYCSDCSIVLCSSCFASHRHGED